MGIDVIVPVYNREKYIGECIESVLVQTYSDWKLILVDDGSVDASGSICDEYASMDSRISVIHQKNSGVSAARNNGILHSDNEFLCFLDSDDFYEPNALEIMVSTLTDNNVDAAFFNMIDFYPKKTVLKQARLNTGEYSFLNVSDILIDDGTLTGILFGSACATIYKRDVIKQFNIFFDENITKNEDGIFNIRYISECSKIYYDGEKYIYNYRHYKTEKKEIELSFDPIWTMTNDIIVKIYKKKQCSDDILKKQIGLRNISTAFWTILTVGNSHENIFRCSNFICSILKSQCVSIDYAYLSDKISFPKRVISILMKRKYSLCLTMVVKFIIPLLRK